MDRRDIPHQALIATLLLLGGTVGALYLTLFPFDFFRREPLSFGTLLAHFDVNFVSRYTAKDFPRNVALFVPIGFGLAGMLPQRRPAVVRLALALGAGALLAFGIEVAQLFLRARFTAVADLLANALGALIGAYLYLLWGERWVVRPLSRLITRISRLITPRIALALLALWLAPTLLITSRTARNALPADWALDAPLSVAGAGFDVWSGALHQAILADTVLDPAAFTQSFAVADPAALLPAPPFAVYRPAAGAFVDSYGSAPTLELQSGAGAQPWWRSSTALTPFSAAVLRSGKFTLIADLTPAAADDPAPIMVLGASPSVHSLSLRQAGADLALRVRTRLGGTDGGFPELLLANRLADPVMQRVVLSLDRTSLRIATDPALPVVQVDLHPALTLFLSRAPVAVDMIYADHLQRWIYWGLYAALIFAPAGLLLGRATERLSLSLRLVLIIAGVLACTFLIEVGIARAAGNGLHPTAIVAGLLCGLAGAGIVLVPHRFTPARAAAPAALQPSQHEA